MPTREDSMISLVMQHSKTAAEAVPAALADLTSTAQIWETSWRYLRRPVRRRRQNQTANNGPMKGANLRARVNITFEEAVFGCEKELEIVLKDECTTCHGTGAKPGTSPVTCPKCKGQRSDRLHPAVHVRYGTKRTNLSGLWRNR